MTEDTQLRLSALRALLGRIHPTVQLVKVKNSDGIIVLTCITSGEPVEDAKEAISEAAAEIISDFPDLDIQENVFSSRGAIPKENLLDEGWIYLAFGL